MATFEILTDDWKKIPQNLRYIILAGIFLIANTWLLDHWGTGKIYTIFGWDVRDAGYSFGFSVILFSFILLIAKQLGYLIIGFRYRLKYPISKLNKSFSLAWFNGRLILFDHKQKKYFHVLPWETAQDLLFVGMGEQLQDKFETDKKIIINVFGSTRTIDISQYKDGGDINTQI